jgi:hypothetical protein
MMHRALLRELLRPFDRDSPPPVDMAARNSSASTIGGNFGGRSVAERIRRRQKRPDYQIARAFVSAGPVKKIQPRPLQVAIP